MRLTLLKADGYFVAWMDKKSVYVGMTMDELFGRLSRSLEEAIQTDESITASWENEFKGKHYVDPSFEDVLHSVSLLSCFHATLIDETKAAEAPK